MSIWATVKFALPALFKIAEDCLPASGFGSMRMRLIQDFLNTLMVQKGERLTPEDQLEIQRIFEEWNDSRKNPPTTSLPPAPPPPSELLEAAKRETEMWKAIATESIASWAQATEMWRTLLQATRGALLEPGRNAPEEGK